MIDGDALRLVFFALVILGWIVKSVIDARRQHEERRSRPRVPAPSTPPTVPGRIPPPPKPPRRPPPPEVGPAESAGAAPKTTVAEVPRFSEVQRLTEVSGLTEVAGLSMGSLEAATAAITEEGSRRLAGLVRRLGGSPGALPRDLARAGMLWSEVLGAPRSVRGLHHAPVVGRPRI